MPETFASDSASGCQTPKKYAELINNYESANEKLRRQLEELKNTSNSSRSELLYSPEYKDKAKELAEVQDLLHDKNRAFIADHLEAALWLKATSMFEKEATTRKRKQGMLKLHQTGLDKLKKNTWVEVHVSEGRACKNEYEPGYVILEYADSKNAETFNQFKVIRVFMANLNSRELTFSASVVCNRIEKVLVFECDTELQREDWIKCISTALADVRDTYNRKSYYTLKLEFRKQKIGLLIKERFLDKLEVDEETKKDCEKFGKALKKTSKEIKVWKDERPCELSVKQIVDKDLRASGLQEGSVLSMINDTVLVGKASSQQLKLLSETPKPFMLTFTGQNFRNTAAKVKSALAGGYFSILKKLVAFEDYDIKKAFGVIIRGTLFERELNCSNDPSATIIALLDNQRRLMDILLNIATQAGKQQEQSEFKE